MTNEKTTDIALLPPSERALIVLESTKTETHLRELVAETATITEVTDGPGREQAHRVGMRLKNARVTIEKTGKTAREDAQSFSKAVIDEEKRLKGIIAEEEKRVLGLRDAYDAKIEAEKEARRQAEERRIAEIKSKIEGIRALPLALANASSSEIEAERQALADFTPSKDVFAEFTDECFAALNEAGHALNDLYDRIKAQEEAAAAVAAERERLALEALKLGAKLAAEREAFEAEKAAYEAEKRAFEAAKAAAAEEAAKTALSLDDVLDAAAPAAIAEALRSDAPSGAETEPATRTFVAGNGVRSVQQVAPVEPDDLATATQNGAEAWDELPPEANTAWVDSLRGNGEPVPEGMPMIQGEIGTINDGLTIVPTPFYIRQHALATAKQFEALAGKVEQCGFAEFANTLRSAGQQLHDGAYDAALAAADHDALIAADNLMLDATVNAIDALEAA